MKTKTSAKPSTSTSTSTSTPAKSIKITKNPAGLTPAVAATVPAKIPSALAGAATLAALPAVRRIVSGAPKAEPAAKEPKEKPAPSVECLCGCGQLCHTAFAPGHDTKVKAALIKEHFGSIAAMARFLKGKGLLCNEDGSPTDAGARAFASWFDGAAKGARKASKVAS
jgi:hypothetical protein